MTDYERIARNNEILIRLEKHIYPHELEAIKKWLIRMEVAPTNEKLIYSEALSVLFKSIKERKIERKKLLES